jgi:hypothetical protein
VLVFTLPEFLYVLTFLLTLCHLPQLLKINLLLRAVVNEGTVIGFDVLSNSAYREAVMEYSPGLPR